MVNKFIIIGNISSQPELKDQGSYLMITFQVALIDSYSKKTINLTINKFERPENEAKAQRLANSINIGDQVFIEGKITASEFTTRQGERVSKLGLSASSISHIEDGSAAKVQDNHAPFGEDRYERQRQQQLNTYRPPAPPRRTQANLPGLDDDDIPF